MYQTINFSQFCDAFEKMDRKDNFTYEGKKALFEYLERYEEDLDEKIEFDVVALCCEYSEYKNLDELKENYSDIETMQDLEDHTSVIMIDDESFLIQDF